MSIFDPEILQELCGLSFGLCVTGAVVGLLLWLTGWWLHRFWIVLAITVVVMGLGAIRSSRGVGAVTIIDEGRQVPKEQWTMPPAALLSRPRWSSGRHAMMLALGAYMVVALALLIVKSVQLAGG